MKQWAFNCLVIIMLFTSFVVQSQTEMETRFDELVDSLSDRRLAARLEKRRDDLLAGIKVWCLEQRVCDSERLSSSDLFSYMTLLGNDFAWNLQLQGKITLAISEVEDSKRQQRLLRQRKELAGDFKQFCALNLYCSVEEVTVDELEGYIRGWRSRGFDFIESQAVPDRATDSPKLPVPSWDCTEFSNDQDNRVRYGWLYWREARIFLNPEKARRMQGPLVYFWHSSNENWEQVYRVLGRSVIEEIVSEGGILVVPHAGAPADMPWYILNPATVGIYNDFKVADQLAACAEQLYDVDESRIYTMGFGEGGLQSVAMAKLRSNYIAAVATYSGGQLPWYSLEYSQAPDNYYTAYVSYGRRGEDASASVEYEDTSESFVSYLEWRGFHEAVVCQQDRDHTMPYGSRRKGWNFIKTAQYRRLPSSGQTDFKPVSVQRNQPEWCD